MKTSDEIERNKKRDATRLKRELAAERRKNKNDKKGNYVRYKKNYHQYKEPKNTCTFKSQHANVRKA